MTAVREIGAAALRRLARGFPAFECEPFSPLQMAQRRDALKWLRAAGYVEVTETGERGCPDRRPVCFTPELRLPRVTDAGRDFLKSVSV